MMSAQLRWECASSLHLKRSSALTNHPDFFSYVAYIGSFVSCMLFQGPALWRSYKQQWQGGRVHNDKLTQLARQYPQVPLWWNLALFG